MDNNVAWACLACGAVTEHPNASKAKGDIVIRKTTLCLKCQKKLSPEEARAYLLPAVNNVRK